VDVDKQWQSFMTGPVNCVSALRSIAQKRLATLLARRCAPAIEVSTASAEEIGAFWVGQITKTEGLHGFGEPWGLTSDSAGKLRLGDAKHRVDDVLGPMNSFTTSVGASVFPEPYTRSVTVARTTDDVDVGEAGPEDVFAFKPKLPGNSPERYETISRAFVVACRRRTSQREEGRREGRTSGEPNAWHLTELGERVTQRLSLTTGPEKGEAV
jgi:hypothetical protein